MTNEDMEWFASIYNRSRTINRCIDNVLERIDNHLGNTYSDCRVLNWYINGETIVVEYTSDGESADYNIKFPFEVFTIKHDAPLWKQMVNDAWAVTKIFLDDIDRQRKELEKRYRKEKYERLKEEFGDK